MSSTPTATLRHPTGLRVLFLTEMWERFSYYLMIGLFPLYLLDSQTGGMGWSGPKAASVVGSYIAAVYFTPFLGGLIADRVLGYRTSVVLGGMFMGLGHVLLAMPGVGMLYAALVSLVVGNGLFKPNMSTMVGRLYPADSPLRDRAYTIFYMGVNIGAFICNFVAAIVRNSFGWHWAFATAGFGMGLGVVIFLVGQRWIRHADISKEERASRPRESLQPLFVQCLLPAVVIGAIGYVIGDKVPFLAARLGPTTTGFLFACGPVVYFFIRIWKRLENPVERGRVGALLVIYAIVSIFWMVFHQNSTALTAWAKSNTDRRPGGLIAPVVRASSSLAENAPPEYFYNAGREVPRPARETYRVVSADEYARMQKADELDAPEDGKPVVATKEMLDKVYADVSTATPVLAVNQHLKVVNAEVFQSINPGFVMLFAPLMVMLWSILNRKRKEPSTPAKIGLGLLITGVSALVMVTAVHMAGSPEGKVSAYWLFGAYGVITVGELCLSPLGLSLVSKLAPARIMAFMMGGWYMATAIGNKLSGVLGEAYFEWDHTTFFLFNAVAASAAGAAILLLLPWLRRQIADGASVEPRERTTELPIATAIRPES